MAGTTTLSADRKLRYDSHTETVNASAFGGSGAVTVATLTGSALAALGDDATLTGGQLRVLATNDVERSDLLAESARGGGGGVIAGAGADAKTVINGTATAELGDDVTLVLGGSYRFNDRVSLNVALGVGVTRDTPDMTLTARVPISF